MKKRNPCQPEKLSRCSGFNLRFPLLALQANLFPLEYFDGQKVQKEVKSKSMEDKRYNMREAKKELGVTRQTLFY